MKLFKKILLIAACFMCMFGMLVGMPISANYVFAVSATLSEYTSFKFTGFKVPEKANVGDTIKIPTPTVKGIDDKGAEVDVSGSGTVKTVLLDIHSQPIENLSDTYKLEKKGRYTMYFEYIEDGVVRVRSEKYYIAVTTDSYKFTDYTNYKYFDASGDVYPFIPTEITSDFDFVIPVLDITKLENDKDVAVNNVRPTITLKNSEGTEILKTTDGIVNSIVDPTVLEGYEITPVSYKRNIKDNDGNLEKEDDGTLKEEVVNTFKIKTNNNKLGLYTLQYFYNGGKDSQISKSYTINVRDNSYKPTDVEVTKLAFTLNGSMPTTADLGKELTLPKVTAKNTKNGDSEVNVYTKVTISYVNPQTKVEEDLTDISDTFKFTPTKKGGYRVRYQIFDVYGNKSSVFPYYIGNVSDEIAPTPRMVEAYNVETTGDNAGNYVGDLKDIVDGKYLLPTYVASRTINHVEDGVNKQFEGVVHFPAIFAEDNVTELKNIKFTREVIRKSDDTVINIATAYKRQNDGAELKSNEEADIYLEKSGEYSVIYSAEDEAGKKAELKSLSFTIGTDKEVLDKPTIELALTATSFDKGDKVKFKQPTATHPTDSYIKVETFYFFGKLSEDTDLQEVVRDSNYIQLEQILKSNAKYKRPTIEDADDTYYYIDSTDAGDDKDITVISYAASYANRMDTSAGAKVAGVSVKSLRNKGTSNDTQAPQLASVDVDNYTGTGNTTADFKENGNGYYDTATRSFINASQNLKIMLPNVKFTDADSGFGVSVKAYKQEDKNFSDSSISAKGANAVVEKTTDASTTKVVKGGTIMPTEAGKYVITYTAKDTNGNISVVSFDVNCKDTEKPSIRVPYVPETFEIGSETFKFTQAIVTDNGKEIENGVDKAIVVIEMVGDDNPSTDGFDGTNYTFNPTALGTYSFRYRAVDKEKNESTSDIITIEVVDTQKPTIELDDDEDENVNSMFSSTGEIPVLLEKATGDAGETAYKNINIPNFTAVDSNKFGNITLDISITCKGEKVDVLNRNKVGTATKDDFGTGALLAFNPVKKDGKYIITYTATDSAENQEVKTFTVAVGDTISPVIKIDKEEENKPKEIYKLNDILKIDRTKITATDISNTGAGNKFEEDFGGDENNNFDMNRIKITLIGPNGTVSFMDGHNDWFKLDKVGTYTLEYKVKDLGGNEATKTYKFEVTTSGSETKTMPTYWKVIIIILCLAVLAFVLWWFLHDIKKKPKDPNKPAKVKEKNKIVI